MITVVVKPTGDNAEAADPESAFTCARTLLADARDAGCGNPTASFYMLGTLVRAGVKASAL